MALRVEDQTKLFQRFYKENEKQKKEITELSMKLKRLNTNFNSFKQEDYILFKTDIQDN